MSLLPVQQSVIACARCTRLRRYCKRVALERKPAYSEEAYWGRPVPGFGDPDAQVFIVGLAPAAHGANRTGRMFTGDSSGDFLMRALHKAGFATRPTSEHAADGLELTGAYLTAAVRCAPPDNKPLPAEIVRCAPWLAAELDALPHVRVVVALGRIAYDASLRLLLGRGLPGGGLPAFDHAITHVAPGWPALVASYHPSRQNTNTGRLNEAMFDHVFEHVRDLL